MGTFLPWHARRIAWWLFENIPLGALAPHVLGFALGRRAHRVH